MKTLLAVSDAQARELAEQVLPQCGCAVTSAADPAAALRACETQHFELIVLDRAFAGDSGLDLCRQLRSHEDARDSFIMIAASCTCASEVQPLIEAGADELLQKPLDAAQLKVRVALAARTLAERAERQRVEAVLRDDVERLNLAAKGTSDGFWDAKITHDDPFSPDNYCWYSVQLKQLIGFEDHELPNVLGAWMERVHPDDYARVFAALEAHLYQQVPYEVQYRIRTKSGAYRWFTALGQAIWDAEGKPLRMAGSLRDITERRQMDEALRESEARHRLITEKVTDILWTARLPDELASQQQATSAASPGEDMRNWRFTYVSPAVERLLHYKPEEVVQRRLSDMLTADSLASAERVVREELELDRTDRDPWRHRTTELAHVTKEGNAVWCEVTSSFLRNEKGDPIGVIGVSRDITERKRAEDALRHSEEKWRRLVENSPDIVMMIDRDAKFTFLNRTVSGLTVEGVLGTSAYDYVPPGSQARLRQAIEAAFEMGEASCFESAGDGPYGAPAWYVSRVGPVTIDGQVVAAMIIATDISERRLVELDLRREKTLLRNLLNVHERERKLIAYDIHDGLVQKMTAALMHLDTSGSDGQTPADAKAEFDRGVYLLRSSLTEGRRLISGLRPPILDESGIIAAVEYLVNEARRSLPNLEFTHTTSFLRLAPPLESAVFRVVQEGLNNVLHHSHAHRASVHLAEQGNLLRVDIRDWGRGFDVDHVHEETFGLHGIRERARLLGGEAQILSSIGAGTQIIVDFPIVHHT